MVNVEFSDRGLAPRKFVPVLGVHAVAEAKKFRVRQFSVRLEDLIKEGDVSANIEMRPGDVLVIPESWF